MAKIRTQIGKTYSKQGDYQNALRYFQLAYTAEKLTGSKNLVVSSIKIIGNIYVQLKQDNLAIVYFEKALVFKRKPGLPIR